MYGVSVLDWHSKWWYPETRGGICIVLVPSGICTMSVRSGSPLEWPLPIECQSLSVWIDMRLSMEWHRTSVGSPQLTCSQVTCTDVLRFTWIGMTFANALPTKCRWVAILYWIWCCMMKIVVNLFLARSRVSWIGIGLAWSLSMRDWLLIGSLLWIGCVSRVRFILRRDTSVSPYSRLVPWLLGQLSSSDWHTIDTGLKSDWQWIGIRLAVDWYGSVLD